MEGWGTNGRIREEWRDFGRIMNVETWGFEWIGERLKGWSIEERNYWMSEVARERVACLVVKKAGGVFRKRLLWDSQVCMIESALICDMGKLKVINK